jgi:hypothetical protein
MTGLIRCVALIAVGAIGFSLASCSEKKPAGSVSFSNAHGGDAMSFLNTSNDVLTIISVVINNNPKCKAVLFKVNNLGEGDREGVPSQLPISITDGEFIKVVGIGCNDEEKTTRLNEVELVTNYGTAIYSRE